MRFYAVLMVLTSLIGWGAADGVPVGTADAELNRLCDPSVPLTAPERERLLSKLRISKEGRKVITDFTKQYGGLQKLLIQWDSVSYSQVVNTAERSPASVDQKGRLGTAICVHLSSKLPEIENLADLAHEITHATRLELAVLKGEVNDVKDFVHARLAASGGEADAFGVECQVKKELLGYWDSFCAPYVSEENRMDTRKVLSDLYNGNLSASLTGETYPQLLTRQFKALKNKRTTRQTSGISALENKRNVQ